MNTLLVLLVIAALLWAAKKSERHETRAPPPKDPLDEPLLHWNDIEPFTTRDLVRSICVMGSSGSGKTSGFGMRMGRSLAARKDIGALILASKPEDRATWEGIAKQAGRELIVFGPNEPHRFNLIEFECKAGADARQITETILTTTEALTHSEGRASEPFWALNESRMIHNAVEAIMQAHGKVGTWDIQRLINDAPTSAEMIHSDEWRKGYSFATMERANKNEKTLIQEQDLNLSTQYFFSEYPAMADKTRSSIIASVMGRLHVFNTGIVRELIGGATTITPENFDSGAMVLVDMPVANFGASGAIVAGAWKYAVQRYILRRAAVAETPVTCIWIDEYQNHMTSYDSLFLAECRSHKGCMISLTQSLHSFFSAMGGGQDAESNTKALLTNYGTKVFMTLGDDESAQYAGSLIGRTIQMMGGGSISRGGNIYEEMLGKENRTTSLSEHYEQQVQNARFLHGLRCGGPENNFFCDGIVIKNSSSFSNGENWMKVEFPQR